MSNISAFDSGGQLIWKAPIPKETLYDVYYEFKVDKDDSTVLLAYSNNSFRYRIDVRNGKIIDYTLLK